jgi:hypothetical protein
MALFLFPETEIMSPKFYLGAVLILSTLLMDGIFKNYKKRSKKFPV